MEPSELTALHPAYPSRLRSLRRAPASLHAAGGSLEAERVVAIVGSREAEAGALAFAKSLAGTIVRSGGVVVSGGALGIDGAAHEGAMDAGGRTWLVAPCGHLHHYPEGHADLFARIARGPGAVLWPFSPDTPPRGFLYRNQVLVGLADAVVVVQAGARSGALHAAGCAHRLGRPLWVCPAPPWLDAYAGSRQLLDRSARTGARPLLFEDAFLGSLGLTPEAPRSASLDVTRSPNEAAVLRAISSTPLHLDAVASRAALPVPEAVVALLTLALENVVVEGPAGFFRRRDGR